MSKHSRHVQEVVTHPYSSQTAFHKHSRFPAGVTPPIEGVLAILHDHYSLPLGSYTVGPVISPQASPCSTLCLSTQLGDTFLFLGLAVGSALSECELSIRRVLLQQRTATFGFVTNGSDHVFLQRRHDSDRCEYASDLPRGSRPGTELDLFGGQDGGEAQLPEGKLETVFFEAHSIIRDVDGMHDDEALDELCKIIFTVLASQSQAQGGYSTRSKEEHPLIRPASVRGLYTRAVMEHGVADSGDAFTAPLRLSDASLTKVWRTLARWDFATAPADLKGRAFQKVLDPAIRAGMGQFFTPGPVVEFMVEAIAPRFGECVLDPFCGSGHFLTETLAHVAREEVISRRELELWASENLHGIEKSERMLRLARTDQLLHNNKAVSFHRADALAPFQNFARLRPHSFDVILTNPPFGSLLGPEALDSIGAFDLARRKGSTPVDVLGLERSIQFLRPGGRLAIVLPEGLFTNKRLIYVREWLLRNVSPVAIISLPVETFAPFGANVRTAVFFGLKGVRKTEHSLESVIVGGADSVGYDPSGKPTEAKNDLPELARVIQRSFEQKGERASVA